MTPNNIETNKDVEILEMCGNCFYYKQNPQSSQKENSNTPLESVKERIVRFVECSTCARTALTMEGAF